MPVEDPLLKRVLMTADTVGGVWTYALELSRALACRGIEVCLATMGAPLSEEQHEEARQIPHLRLFESTFKLEWMADPWEDVKAAGDWLLELEACVRPNVIHLNGYAHGALPWRAPTLVVGHSCVLSWWKAVRNESAPAVWDRYRNVVTQGLQAAHIVLAPSRTMLNSLDYYYGPLGEVAVVPNGRRASLFCPGVKEDFVLSVGRIWDEAKSVRVLSVIAPNLPWPVYIAGEQNHPDGGAAQASHLHLLGHLSPAALTHWYAKASIYALPARYEPFGLSVLEAALAGCALVLGDIASLREFWTGAALFVSPENPAALEAALCSLIADDTRRAELSAQARARGLEFTPQRMAEGYLEAYRKICAS